MFEWLIILLVGIIVTYIGWKMLTIGIGVTIFALFSPFTSSPIEDNLK